MSAIPTDRNFAFMFGSVHDFQTDYLKPFGPGLLSFSFSSVCEVGRLDVIKSE